jgi:uncharacterized SAM-binding protein YcdF (DUF218 family)
MSAVSSANQAPEATRPACTRILRRLLLVVGLPVAAAVLWFPFAGSLLIDSEPPSRADAIVVLAGNAADRLTWAEQLREQGFADLLVVSDERVHTHSLETTWLALYQAGISAPELPDSALVVLDDPLPESTIDEARRDADLLEARGLHSVLLVTDAFHSRRAVLLFRAFLARKGMSVHSVPVADSLDLAHWWTHPLAARRVVEEWAKFVYYLVQGAYW